MAMTTRFKEKQKTLVLGSHVNLYYISRKNKVVQTKDWDVFLGYAMLNVDHTWEVTRQICILKFVDSLKRIIFIVHLSRKEM